MPYIPKRGGLAFPDPALGLRIRDLLREHGPAKTAEMLDISREAAVAIGAECPVLKGSLAQTREQLRAMDQAPNSAGATLGAE